MNREASSSQKWWRQRGESWYKVKMEDMLVQDESSSKELSSSKPNINTSLVAFVVKLVL